MSWKRVAVRRREGVMGCWLSWKMSGPPVVGGWRVEIFEEEEEEDEGLASSSSSSFARAVA